MLYRLFLLIMLVICFLYSFCYANLKSLENPLLETTKYDLVQHSSISGIKIIKKQSFLYKEKAEIIILNKITAKSELVQFKVGITKFFGKISIQVHKCAKSNNPLRSSNLMLITVFDNSFDDGKFLLFHGWIDSSNLSISTLEHPVYEIISRNCLS